MSLSEFIKTHKNEARDDGVDWQARVTRWKDEVMQLFTTIDHALQDAGLDEDDISYSRKEIREDFIGLYEVKRMAIHLGSSNVVFDPVATLIIGGVGRVDVSSSSNRARLIAIDASEDVADGIPVEARKWKWVIVNPDKPLNYQDFSKDKIEYLLSLVVGKNGDA